MRAKLLKRVRAINPIYKQGNKYKYISETKCSGDVWFYESDWVDDPNKLRPKRTEIILQDAKHLFNCASCLYRRKRRVRWA